MIVPCKSTATAAFEGRHGRPVRVWHSRFGTWASGGPDKRSRSASFCREDWRSGGWEGWRGSEPSSKSGRLGRSSSSWTMPQSRHWRFGARIKPMSEKEVTRETFCRDWAERFVFVCRPGCRLLPREGHRDGRNQVGGRPGQIRKRCEKLPCSSAIPRRQGCSSSGSSYLQTTRLRRTPIRNRSTSPSYREGLRLGWRPKWILTTPVMPVGSFMLTPANTASLRFHQAGNDH